MSLQPRPLSDTMKREPCARQVLKHGDRAVFVKELTFRSLDSRNLTQVNMLYQELRKRIKLRDQKAEQEKNLVVQTKLIRIKDQRVPR